MAQVKHWKVIIPMSKQASTRLSNHIRSNVLSLSKWLVGGNSDSHPWEAACPPCEVSHSVSSRRFRATPWRKESNTWGW